ncbi:MAG: DUF3592 domain-containing protein [Pseudomonadota bacterium]
MAFQEDFLALQRDANIRKAKRTIGLGIVLVGLAVWLSVNPIRLMTTGERQVAKIAEVEVRKETALLGPDERYYPHAEFTTSTGEVVKIRDRFSDEKPPWAVGDAVDVLYFEGAPNDAVIDRGMRNFSWSGVALAAAIICLIAGYRRLYSERRKYRHAQVTIDELDKDDAGRGDDRAKEKVNNH